MKVFAFTLATVLALTNLVRPIESQCTSSPQVVSCKVCGTNVDCFDFESVYDATTCNNVCFFLNYTVQNVDLNYPFNITALKGSAQASSNILGKNLFPLLGGNTVLPTGATITFSQTVNMSLCDGMCSYYTGLDPCCDPANTNAVLGLLVSGYSLVPSNTKKISCDEDQYIQICKPPFTKAPTKSPTMSPTKSPTPAPTPPPTPSPTKAPTASPTASPTPSPVCTVELSFSNCTLPEYGDAPCTSFYSTVPADKCNSVVFHFTYTINNPGPNAIKVTTLTGANGVDITSSVSPNPLTASATAVQDVIVTNGCNGLSATFSASVMAMQPPRGKICKDSKTYKIDTPPYTPAPTPPPTPSPTKSPTAAPTPLPECTIKVAISKCTLPGYGNADCSKLTETVPADKCSNVTLEFTYTITNGGAKPVEVTSLVGVDGSDQTSKVSPNPVTTTATAVQDIYVNACGGLDKTYTVSVTASQVPHGKNCYDTDKIIFFIPGYTVSPTKSPTPPPTKMPTPPPTNLPTPPPTKPPTKSPTKMPVYTPPPTKMPVYTPPPTKQPTKTPTKKPVYPPPVYPPPTKMPVYTPPVYKKPW